MSKSKDTPQPYDAIKDMLRYNAIHKKRAREKTCVRAYDRERKKKDAGVLEHRLPAKIMEIVPRAIPRQRTSPSFGNDVVLGSCWSTFPSTGTITLPLLWLLLLLRPPLWLWLRWTSLCADIHRHRHAQAAAAASATTGVASPGIAKQVCLAHLALPQQVPAKTLTELRREHLPARRARRRWWRWLRQVPRMIERDRRGRDGLQKRSSAHPRCLRLALIVRRSSARRVRKRCQPLLCETVGHLNRVIRVIRAVAFVFKLLALWTALGSVSALARTAVNLAVAMTG